MSPVLHGDRCPSFCLTEALRACWLQLAMLHHVWTALLMEALRCAPQVLLIIHSHSSGSDGCPQVFSGSQSHGSTPHCSTHAAWGVAVAFAAALRHVWTPCAGDCRLCECAVILSIDRRESSEQALETVRLAAAHRQQGVVGIDLSGNPSIGDWATWEPALQVARQAGLKITLHAGEVRQHDAKCSK